MFDQAIYHRLLTTRRLGKILEIVEEVDSTNTYVAAKYELRKESSLVVLAERQTQGRGRFGKIWESFPEESLTFSFPWQAPKSLLAPNVVTLAIGVALAEAVSGVASCDAALKYPNDLYLGDKKAAGVLTELKGTGDNRFAIIGVGVNVNNKTSRFDDEEVRQKAISIKEATGKNISREEVLALFFNYAEPLLDALLTDGVKTVIEKYRKLTNVIGREVIVTGAGEPIVGVAEEIAITGALVVNMNGTRKTVVSGEINFAKSSPRRSA